MRNYCFYLAIVEGVVSGWISLGLGYLAVGHFSARKNIPAPSLLQPHFSFPSLHLQTESPTDWAHCFHFMLPVFLFFVFFSPQVANLACSISNNEEGVKLVRMAATQIDSLCPQVSKTQSLRQNFSQTPQVNAFGCYLFTLIAVWRFGTKLIDDRLISVASWIEGRDSR